MVRLAKIAGTFASATVAVLLASGDTSSKCVETETETGGETGGERPSSCPRAHHALLQVGSKMGRAPSASDGTALAAPVLAASHKHEHRAQHPLELGSLVEVDSGIFDRPPASDAPPIGLLAEWVMFPDRLYSRISVDARYRNHWEELYTFPERRPRTFNVMMATTKTFLGDLVVQLLGRPAAGGGNKGTGIDWRRSATFAAFGCIYVGLVQWFFYVTIFVQLCPNAIRFANEPWSAKLLDRAGQWDLIVQTFLDNFLLAAFVYFPIFYALKELIHGGAPRTWKGLKVAACSAMSKYRQNCMTDVPVSWAVWIPADILVFSVPMFVRMPLDHSVAFGWTMILSYMRGAAH